MKIYIYKDESGFWRWRMKASNGKIVADSGEGYATRSNARRAVKRLTNIDWAGSPALYQDFPIERIS